MRNKKSPFTEVGLFGIQVRPILCASTPKACLACRLAQMLQIGDHFKILKRSFPPSFNTLIIIIRRVSRRFGALASPLATLLGAALCAVMPCFTAEPAGSEVLWRLGSRDWRRESKALISWLTWGKKGERLPNISWLTWHRDGESQPEPVG